jgi:chemosensory pili system protein ChpA (sensor histidine kinase/response regulator)
VEQQLELVAGNLAELSRTVTRLKQQLGSLEVETEAQILHRHDDGGSARDDFDPLELDRYSAIQQYSRALAETASDVASLQQLLESQTTDAQSLLQQQSRVVSQLQNGLLRTRMVSFQRHVPRLARIVRQTATDTAKQAELLVDGATGELDRQVLERLLPLLEHLLSNAVVHGIESPGQRAVRGKPAVGTVRLTLRREGAEVVLVVADDGNGMDLDAIRARARADGLLAPDRDMAEDDLLQLVLEPGFSTAATVTQNAGRGVGMDVVATELRKLGGVLQLRSVAGSGASITLRLPFTMAVTQALIVRIGDECYALPLPVVDGVVRLTGGEIATHMATHAPAFVHAGQRYRIQHLGVFVGLEAPPAPTAEPAVQVVLVRAGEYATGLVVDELLGTREIVLKSIGPQLASIRGLSGATLLGDGRIALILDIATLLRAEWLARSSFAVQPVQSDLRPVVMVVDDSITVRRVTQRLLERNGMRVITARDGLDALTVMEELLPDVVLLDVEMPRMDGYELVERLRADVRTRALPIIMITSRVGEKHRTRAMELGVSDYLGKPWQETQLLDALAALLQGRT